MTKAALVLFLAALGLAGAARAQWPVPTDDPQRPRLMFADSMITINNQCPVRRGALDPTYRPVYVNGRPVGFC